MAIDPVDVGLGAGGGVFATLAGMVKYFSNKVKGIHGRVNTIESHVNDHRTEIAVLRANHTAIQDTCEELKTAISEVNRKQDSQTTLLVDVLHSVKQKGGIK